MKKDKSASKSLTSIAILCLIILLFTILWLLLHRLIISHQNLNVNNHDHHRESMTIQQNNKQHIQSLIDQTHLLLNQIKQTNISLTRNIINNIQILTSDSSQITTDIRELNRELDKLEFGYKQCEKSKYVLNEKLLSCQQNEKVRRSSSNSSSSSTSSFIDKLSKGINNNNHHHHIDSSSRSRSSSSSSSCGVDGGITNNNSNKWLAIGIPTVARTHDEDYLMKSIDAIANQLSTDPSDLLYNKVIVHIINVQINSNPHHKHIVFDQVRSKYSSANNHPKSQYFIFTEIDESDILPDLKYDSASNAVKDHGDANHPGFLVRRQTRNIVTVIRKSLHLAQFYLFLEDDMQICANGLLAIQYLLNKASRYHNNWMAIRASYGMYIYIYIVLQLR